MPLINPNGQPVIICTACGKGFLCMPIGNVDEDAIWRWAGQNLEGGVCGGEIKIVDRSFAMQVATQYETIGDSEEWLRGKRS